MDLRQVRALTLFTLKSEWRQASMRMMRGRRKTSRWWAYGQILIYLVTGAATIQFFHFSTTPEAFFAASSFLLIYVATITASNIFLAFSAGFLSPDEVAITSPLPISSETFFFSRLTVLIFYSTVITLLFVCAPVIFTIFAGQKSVLAAIGLVIAALLSNVAAALAVIVLYGLLMRRLSKDTLARVIGYAQFIGSMLIAMGWVFIPRMKANVLEFTPQHHSYLNYIPAYWLGSIASIISGANIEGTVMLALAGIIFLAVVSLGAHVLLGKHYQSEVGELANSTSAIAKDHSKPGFIFRLYYRFARTHEARAVFTIIRAQFRFDTKFRMSLLAVLPMPFIYLGLALMQGAFPDPFNGDLKGIVGTQMIYFFAMLMPMMLMQNMTMTENYRAAWIFFALPAERSRLLLAVRNTILISFILPYLVLLAAVFSYFIPPLHAIKHVLVLGAIGNFIFQGYVIGQAKMPFAQQRRPNQKGVAQFGGMFLLMIVPMGLLVLDMYFGYKSESLYWSSLALLITLTVLLEKLMQSRIRVRLEREEFQG